MYKDAVLPVKTETFSGMAAKSPIGQCIRSVLRRALVEKRLTIGLLPTLQLLSANSAGALFCFTTQALPGDCATHMQEVLLEAYCVENEICTIKVDSPEKMRKILGISKSLDVDFTCVLVRYPYTDPYTDSQEFDIMSQAERDLIDHCETNYELCTEMPVIKLPEK